MSENELDDMTKKIVHDHFEEFETKEKWKKILADNYGVKSFEDLEEWTSFKEKKNKSKTKFFYLTSLSTLVASVLIFVIFTLNTGSDTTNPLDNLMEEYYSSPIQYRNSKSPESISTNRQLAFEFYNNKDYKSSAKLLETVINKDDFIEDDYFYLGLSYLYQKQAEKSAAIFKFILDQGNLQRRDASTWFLALSLIEDKQYPEAEKYLSEVATWEGNTGKIRKARQAKELLELIKNQ